MRPETVWISREFSAIANVELFTMKIGNYYIISGYKSPKTTNLMFEKALVNVMEKIPIESHKILIGDFNYNILNNGHENNQKNYLIDYLNKYDLHTKLPPLSVTTNLNTQIDVVFGNFEDLDCGVYETYFSYHKPIYAVIGKKSLLINNDQLIITDKHDDFDKETHFSSECIEISNNDELINQNMEEGRFPINPIQMDDYNYAITVEKCEEVRNPRAYIQDYHVNFFHEIINRQLEEWGIFNFAQDTGYIRAFLTNLQGIPRTSKNIQIIYSGQIGKNIIGHWICTRYDGNGNVHIYDSQNNEHLKDDQKDYLNALYKFPTKFIFHRVQEQTNGIDCGVFAIFFATCLCFDRDPSERYDYDVNALRNHVSAMLSSRRLLLFNPY